MRTLFLLLTCAGAAASQQPNTLTAKEITDGWVLLFDGDSLYGWTPEGAAKWRVDNGVVIADEGGYGWLRTNAAFRDYSLRCDFRTTADGNSGIFLRSAKEGNRISPAMNCRSTMPIRTTRQAA
ncbi:MAG: DUF1080 domain-containing protein [Acidobacteria bacterium]|nr:DUF1080 domain-containing protein [Acidobacteriota bacterium]